MMIIAPTLVHMRGRKREGRRRENMEEFVGRWWVMLTTGEWGFDTKV